MTDPPIDAFRRFGVMVGFVVAPLTVAALLAVPVRGYASAVGLSWLILLAGASVGVFFGFLFSVPRIVAADGPRPAGEGSEGNGNGAAQPVQRLLQSNSNLERISDWLTTMIVGVTLINFSQIVAFFRSFSSYLETSARVFGDPGAAAHAGVLPVVGTMLLITGLVVGFLGMYLNTRLYLTSMLLEAEKTLVRPEVLPEPATAAVIRSVQSLPNPTQAQARAVATRRIYPREAVATMNKLLYEPEGYEKTIELSGALMGTPAEEKAEFWFYLAAAFGQKHKKLVSDAAPTNEIAGARDNALDAARRAVELDPGYRRELSRIAMPAGPDDDLASLRDNPDFQRIVQTA